MSLCLKARSLAQGVLGSALCDGILRRFKQLARQPPFWRLMERVAMTLLDQHKNRSDNIEEPATNTDQPVMIKTRRRASVRLSDLKLTPPTWLIHGILETQALAFMIGASGSGKTFAAVDMAVDDSRRHTLPSENHAARCRHHVSGRRYQLA
jgi:phosphate starvation-inducible protein PhoH